MIDTAVVEDNIDDIIGVLNCAKDCLETGWNHTAKDELKRAVDYIQGQIRILEGEDV